MKRFLACALALILSAIGAGCLSSDLRITVRPDGPGTITHTLEVTEWGLAQVPAQARVQAQAPPDTEIYLASLSTAANGMLTVGPPTNITTSRGYDNQPSFAPDGSAIFFTSARAARSGSAVQAAGSSTTDIYRYDIAARKTVRVTDTPESEYSPTVTPDGRHLSVVRVEADGTQRLWRFTLDGNDPELVLPEVKPVGYHAWAGEHSVALFVLGSPVTLRLVDTTTGKAEEMARDIGRSLQPAPSGGISYVQRQTSATGAPVLTVMHLDPATRSVKPLVDLMEGVTEPYVAWMADGTLLVAHEASLYRWRAGGGGWQAIADLGRFGLRDVTRLAVSPRGDRIAIVAQPR